MKIKPKSTFTALVAALAAAQPFAQEPQGGIQAQCPKRNGTHPATTTAGVQT